MNKKYTAFTILFLTSLFSLTAQAKQTTTVEISSHYFGNYDNALRWTQTRKPQIQSEIDAAASSSLPGFRGSADVTVSARVRNDSMSGFEGPEDRRFTGVLNLHLDNPAYAFEQTSDKFPGMTCGEAEVEGRRLHPHAFFSTYGEYAEGGIFHRVRGCKYESASVTAVTN